MKYSILLLLVFSLCSCTSNKVRDRLTAIEKQIRTNPEVALSSLDSLANAEKELFQKEEFHARYILLNTYANYRLDLEGKDDSLINIATQYFLVHGTAHDKLLCQLLYGGILINAEKYGFAMFQLKEAISDGASTQDHLLLGQAYANLTRLCGLITDSERIVYARKAIEEYTLHGDEKYIIDATTFLGLSQLDRHHPDSAVSILRGARERAIKLGNEYLILDTNKSLAEAECINQQYDSACCRLKGLFAHKGYKITSIDYDVMAVCMVSLGQKDSALYYLKMAEQMAGNALTQKRHFEFAHQVYAKMEDYQSAYKALKQYAYLSDISDAEIINNAVRKEQKVFAEKKLKETKEKAILYFSIGGVLLAIVTFFCFFLFAKHTKTKKQKRVIEKEKADIQTKYEIQKENKKDTVQEMKQTGVYNSFTLCLINKHEIKENDWEELYKLFNNRLPAFEQLLKREHEMNDTDWRICMLLKLDFQVSSIAVILNKSRTQISNENNKLAKKFLGEDKGSRDWVNYVKNL